MDVIRNLFKKKNEHLNNGNKYFTSDDYDSTFAIPKKILSILTIRMTHDLTPFARKCWDIVAQFELTNLVIVVILEVMSIVETASGGTFDDAIRVFSMMPCTGVSTVATLRTYKMLKHRPIFENLVTELGEMWPRGKLEAEERRIVSKAVKQLIIISKGYYWCNNALFISFILPTHIESIKRLLGYENVMRTHAYSYWLPFDYYKPVYIDIYLLIQTWHAVIVIFVNLCGDLLFCAFLSHITTQFDLLSIRIQRLVHVPPDKQLLRSYPLGINSVKYQETSNSYQYLNDTEREKMRNDELVEIIKRHQALIRLSADVEKVFSFSMLVTFLNSSITICLCGFCCVVIEKWNAIGYKSFLVTSLSQTFLICWHGQKLLDSSTGVSHALYYSGWYQASRKIRSTILIMLHRAQKEVHITTYGFSIISLESYSKIIKTAWSYFTLLINTYKQ